MIYYFSATGNCRYVAERIAHELRTEAVSITNCSLQITTTADEVLGFIFPTYFWGLPSYVDDFLKAVTFSGEAPAYTFVLATYGTTTGQADRFAAGESRDGLVDDGLEDGGGEVLFRRALVDEGLDIAFGKNAAAAGDGVGVMCLLCQLVHLGCFYIQQGSHLVDKSTGAAGAAVVHTCVKMAA